MNLRLRVKRCVLPFYRDSAFIVFESPEFSRSFSTQILNLSLRLRKTQQLSLSQELENQQVSVRRGEMDIADIQSILAIYPYPAPFPESVCRQRTGH